MAAKVIKVKGDATEVETDFKHARPGLIYAKAAEVNARDSQNSGQPMVEVRWEPTKDADGKKIKEALSSIFYYAPVDISKIGPNEGEVHPGWARRLKELLIAFGLPMKGANIAKIEGKEAMLRLKEDTDQDGEYRPKITKVLKAGSVNGDAEEDEDEPEAGSDDESELYTEDELAELSKAELFEVAEEYELDTPNKLTTAAKKRLVAAIIEAQGGEGEEEEDDEEDDEDEVDLSEMDRSELKSFIKENELEVKVTKKMTDDAIREAIEEAMGEEEEEEDEDEDDEEGDNYDELALKDLKEECENRELDSKGTKKLLIARLRKDDQSDPV
jgi:hypothetical protein